MDWANIVPGQLDMKVGSGDRVDAIFQLGQQGLRFEACPKPSVLPDLAGQRYFRVSRMPEREWAAGLDPGARGESLTVAEFARIAAARTIGEP